MTISAAEPKNNYDALPRAFVNITSELMSRYRELLDEIEGSLAEALEEFADAVRENRIEDSLPLLKGDPQKIQRTLCAIQENYQRDPKRMEEYWAKLPSKLISDHSEMAKKRLDIVTKLVLVGTTQRRWSEQLPFSGRASYQLLELIVAKDCLSRIEGAMQRAGDLLEWSVNQASSEQADQYLSEASTCFIYGLFTSSALMCRSLLEEVIERKLPTKFLAEGRLSDSKNRTLGNLLDVVNNNFQEVHFHPDVPKLGRLVNEIGSWAAHERELSEGEALECLKDTHKAVLRLLG